MIEMSCFIHQKCWTGRLSLKSTHPSPCFSWLRSITVTRSLTAWSRQDRPILRRPLCIRWRLGGALTILVFTPNLSLPHLKFKERFSPLLKSLGWCTKVKLISSGLISARKWLTLWLWRGLRGELVRNLSCALTFLKALIPIKMEPRLMENPIVSW